MLRVGLTGGIASGKSTVAALLRSLGAGLIEADGLGRALMEPGQPVFAAIAARFGAEVVDPGGRLDRAVLARLAFAEGRLQELNAIVHPAVIEAQQQWMAGVFEKNPSTIAIVESALIFEVVRDARARGETSGILANWRERMDCVIAVTAPVELRIARYVGRVCPAGGNRAQAEADARRRIAQQIPDQEKARLADEVIENTGDLDDLRRQTVAVWERLKARNNEILARNG
ncbi:MAG: dephospho-CoA kinase [Terracidiphilus sp.]|nr:dephospho-CoA kinase [Terracidiphilus sp.]